MLNKSKASRTANSDKHSTSVGLGSSNSPNQNATSLLAKSQEKNAGLQHRRDNQSETSSILGSTTHSGSKDNSRMRADLSSRQSGDLHQNMNRIASDPVVNGSGSNDQRMLRHMMLLAARKQRHKEFRTLRTSMYRRARAFWIAEVGYYIMFLGLVLMVGFRYEEALLHSIGRGSGDAVCDGLESWIQQEGGIVAGVKCKFMAERGGRTIVATGIVSTRQTYLSVPTSVCMWEHSIREFSKVAHILDTDENIASVDGVKWDAHGEPWRLIIAVEHERHQPDSRWRLYFDSMPDVPTSALWWDSTTVESLQSPILAKQISTLNNVLKETYARIYPNLKEAHPDHWDDRNSFDSFKWSAINVWGRGFDANAQDPQDPNRRIWILVPLLDVVNHQSYVGSYFSDLDNPRTASTFDSWATECYTEGAEVFQSYGTHRSSSHFFMYYGFLPDGHERGDFISLSLDMATAHDMAQVLGSGWSSGFAGNDGHVTEEFLSDFAKYLTNRGKSDWQEPSEEVWQLAISIIASSVRTAISQLPTTMQEDIEMVQQGFDEMGYTKWSILRVRIRFKSILHLLLENLEHRLKKKANDPSAWLTSTKKWLMVNDPDNTLIHRSSMAANLDESLFSVTISL
eukprot:m.220073 g.220073  ORF g.220073 m.220073 type:complete len:627 (+) comp33310_c0_seq2:329-2209(+)